MLSWKNDQVLLWLKNSHQPDDVLESFRVHNITGLTLPMLNSEELKEMGIINLRQRLKILNDISNLVIEKNPTLNSINLNNEHPLLNELESVLISTNLIKNISKGIVEESSSQLIDKLSKKDENNERTNSNNDKSLQNKEYKSLLLKINKLREEVLPMLKDIQDKKPLPAPSPNLNSNSNSNIFHNNNNNNSNSTILASPSRTMFVSNRRNSSDTLTSSLSTDTPSPININKSVIPEPSQQNIISTPTSSIHRNLTPRTNSNSSSSSFNNNTNNDNNNNLSSPKIVPSRSSKRLSSHHTHSHDSNSNSSSDTLKQLRAKTEDPCYKILQAAMRSHKLDKSEWRNYVLIICYGGDKERVLRYDEKPVVVFKELSELGLSPSMMLRQVEETDDTGYGNYEEYETPGGRL